MIHLTVLDTGELNLDQRLYTHNIVKGTTPRLVIKLYKDRYRVVPWDLSTAEVELIGKLKWTDSSPYWEESNISAVWDKTEVSSGILGIKLTTAHTALARNIQCRLVLKVNGEQYITPIFIVRVNP